MSVSPLRVAMSPFEWRVLLFIILREIVSSVPRPLHSSSLPAENLTIKEGGTIYGRVIRTRSLNSQYQVKLPETIGWLEFRFSNNKWILVIQMTDILGSPEPGWLPRLLLIND